MPPTRSDAALAVVILASAKPAVRAAKTELEWARQAKKSIVYVLKVIAKHPKMTAADIILLPDVQQILHVTFQKAGSYTTSQLLRVWQEMGGPSQSEYRDQLIADVIRNTVLASARMHQAITQGDLSTVQGRMYRVAADLARRAGYSVRVAEVRARTERDLLKISTLGKRKMWVSRNDDATCSYCKSLHGLIREVTESFPHDAGGTKLRVYRDLLGPPRHPRCRCKLVPVT